MPAAPTVATVRSTKGCPFSSQKVFTPGASVSASAVDPDLVDEIGFFHNFFNEKNSSVQIIDYLLLIIVLLKNISRERSKINDELIPSLAKFFRHLYSIQLLTVPGRTFQINLI